MSHLISLGYVLCDIEILYSTPFIIFFRSGYKAKSNTDAAPAITTNTMKKSDIVAISMPIKLFVTTLPLASVVG